ncbi:MAG: 23S rRNA (adenine(2503)-C(2))-methyltransferase RlmN [Ignavibacteriales bacterium CG_4_9_14_3_um_filter_30_11]|nr:MAG: 23S rRNA (adenine(2503)-C(2))-methyltransferase RlmN [Ignavibacteriales bacterium CG_4_9_14_3_um_filter_30_11]
MENDKINGKIQLKGMLLGELENTLTELGEQKFRAKQIFKWMYGSDINTFDEMLNIPKELRKKLSESYILNTLRLHSSQVSEKDGTTKYIFETEKNHKIESVIIPDDNRITLCLSTQVGCPLDCKFCATGLMGYKQNLTSGEIIDQYLLASKYFNKKITNIVYMGMGEPLLNYECSISSLKIFNSELISNIHLKHITVSTSGIVPNIYKLADSGLNIRLALSLHSCFNEIRNEIMPINKKYPLAELIEASKYFTNKTGLKITIEYIMLKDVNDRDEDIKGLAKLFSQLPIKINIIPFNSLKHMNPEGLSLELKPTSKERIDYFVSKLKEKNIQVMVRDTQGEDIDAACGQLAIKMNK